MNKLYYALSSLLIASAAVCSAQDGVSYGYCSDYINGVGFNSDGAYWIAGAIQLTDADVAQFDGCEIVGVSVGFGNGRNKDITLFMTEDLAGEPFYTQYGRVRASVWNNIPVTEPVKIEKGKPFYVGYTYHVDNISAKPIGTDDNVDGFTSGADWMAASTTEEDLAKAWKQYGSQVGNICIRIILQGDNLSKTNCIPVGMEMPELVLPGDPFDFTVTFTNASSVPVNNVEVVYQLGTDAEKTVTYTFDEPVATNDRGSVKIHDVTEQDALQIPCWASITKVNGQPNDMADRKAHGYLVCTTGLFERKVVAEKFTGTYCGYCPIGIVGFEYMREKYPTTFIGIEIHNYTSSEPLYCTAYSNMAQSNFTGAPSCVVNRNPVLTHRPEKGSLESSYNEAYTRTSNIGVTASFAPTSSSNLYDVTGTVKVAKDEENADYSLVFVITEDFLGPLPQYNNYNTSVGCPEFSGKGNPVMTKYDGVARNISSDWKGIRGSVPSTLKAGEEYPYTVKNFSLGSTSNPKNANLVVLLIDNATGIIANADLVHFDPDRKDPDPVSVDDTMMAKISVVGGAGYIAFSAEDGIADVYTVAGQAVGSIAAGDSIELPAGIYIVKTVEGVHKVMVR